MVTFSQFFAFHLDEDLSDWFINVKYPAPIIGAIQGVVYRGLPTSDRIKVLWFAYQYDTAQVIKEIK